MTAPQPLQDPAVLRQFGRTLTEAQAALHTELDAFEAELRTRKGDWHATQPGRDWSPAQEAEHVVRINTGITRLLGLLLSDCELRAAPQTPGQLKEGKRQAPADSLPSATGLPWANWEAMWNGHRAALETVAADVRETPGRTAWHPFFGELDALGWLRMVAAHLHSHRELLERSRRAQTAR
ncbi:MAG: DinB family protein [Deinococcus sp.]|nr:DinB family protein [Deinococcus sp.]